MHSGKTSLFVLSSVVCISEPNDQGNPAAAKNLRFQNPSDPPLGLTALFGDSMLLRGSCDCLRRCTQLRSRLANDPTDDVEW